MATALGVVDQKNNDNDNDNVVRSGHEGVADAPGVVDQNNNYNICCQVWS